MKRFVLSINLEEQHFVHKDETNYKMDEIKKENMNEFCILSLTKNRKIQNIKQNRASKPCACFVKRRKTRGKKKTYFFHGKT